MKRYVTFLLIFILLISLGVPSLAAKVYKNDDDYQNAINEQKKGYDESKNTMFGQISL